MLRKITGSNLQEEKTLQVNYRNSINFCKIKLLIDVMSYSKGLFVQLSDIGQNHLLIYLVKLISLICEHLYWLILKLISHYPIKMLFGKLVFLRNELADDSALCTLPCDFHETIIAE